MKSQFWTIYFYKYTLISKVEKVASLMETYHTLALFIYIMSNSSDDCIKFMADYWK